MTWKIRWQGAEKERGKKEEEKNIVGDKSDLLSMHTPHILGGNVEMNLKPPRNSLFSRCNQLYVSSKDSKVADIYAIHVSLFLILF